MNQSGILLKNLKNEYSLKAEILRHFIKKCKDFSFTLIAEIQAYFIKKVILSQNRESIIFSIVLEANVNRESIILSIVFEANVKKFRFASKTSTLYMKNVKKVFCIPKT